MDHAFERSISPLDVPFLDEPPSHLLSLNADPHELGTLSDIALHGMVSSDDSYSMFDSVVTDIAHAFSQPVVGQVTTTASGMSTPPMVKMTPFRNSGGRAAKSQYKIECRRNASGQYLCDHCSFLCNDRNKLMSHNRTQHVGNKSFQCPSCNARFTRLYSLKRHRVEKHGDLSLFLPGTSGAATVAPNATDVSPGPSAALPHSTAAVRRVPPKSTAAPAKDAVVHSCPFQCGFETKNVTLLTLHKKTHLVAKPFFCRECGSDAEYAQERSLVHHVNKRHNGDLTLRATKMPTAKPNKELPLLTNRDNSISGLVGSQPEVKVSKPEPAESYTCDTCSLVTHTFKAFYAHRRTHQQEGVAANSCVYCWQKFRSPDQLVRHIKKIHIVQKLEKQQATKKAMQKGKDIAAAKRQTMKRKLAQFGDSAVKLKCPDCNFLTSSERILESHRGTAKHCKEKDNKKTKKSKNLKPEAEFRCPEVNCDFVTNIGSSVEIHVSQAHAPSVSGIPARTFKTEPRSPSSLKSSPAHKRAPSIPPGLGGGGSICIGSPIHHSTGIGASPVKNELFGSKLVEEIPRGDLPNVFHSNYIAQGVVNYEEVSDYCDNTTTNSLGRSPIFSEPLQGGGEGTPRFAAPDPGSQGENFQSAVSGLQQSNAAILNLYSQTEHQLNCLRRASLNLACSINPSLAPILGATLDSFGVDFSVTTEEALQDVLKLCFGSTKHD